MERKIFHGNIKPNDIAQALMAEFNRGNLQAQAVGQATKLAVQIATRMGSQSGGQTAMTVSIQSVDDGVMVDIGEQAWMGVAASLGQTAISALRNPFSLFGRLDDLAQDIENIQLKEKVWQTIGRVCNSLAASHELSERLRRITCEHCGIANPLGEASCIACGAPLGSAHPATCSKCGFVVTNGEQKCPNCGQNL
ncbi:MAG: zinc ribbon domain-containing protein [Anaerolineales bacterium]|nr:zinc ribbon domain-containing protein [Anaerolineales bacterium]